MVMTETNRFLVGSDGCLGDVLAAFELVSMHKYQFPEAVGFTLGDDLPLATKFKDRTNIYNTL